MKITKAYEMIKNKLDSWLEMAIAFMPNFLVAVILILIFFVVAKLLKSLVDKIEGQFKENHIVILLIGKMIFLVVMVVGIFAALSVLQLDKAVTSLLAGAGIIGLALGLAFQESAANFLAGLIIAFRKPVQIGDLIESNTHQGTIIELNLRAIWIQIPTGQIVIIPNKDILFKPIVNFTKTGYRRMDLKVGISYGENLQKVKDVTMQSLEKLEGRDPNKLIKFWFDGFGDSSIDFTVAVWTNRTGQLSYLDLRSDAVMAIKKAYDENDITIPFPIRTLDFGIKGGKQLDQVKFDSSYREGRNP
ncbi:MAG: mechanosensitive ion channel family protein [Cryomorphaceae bacterium]|nr:mechanosensitive ion channel [Flavobacteriales bacterium]